MRYRLKIRDLYFVQHPDNIQISLKMPQVLWGKANRTILSIAERYGFVVDEILEALSVPEFESVVRMWERGVRERNVYSIPYSLVKFESDVRSVIERVNGAKKVRVEKHIRQVCL